MGRRVRRRIRCIKPIGIFRGRKLSGRAVFLRRALLGRYARFDIGRPPGKLPLGAREREARFAIRPRRQGNRLGDGGFCHRLRVLVLLPGILRGVMRKKRHGRGHGERRQQKRKGSHAQLRRDVAVPVPCRPVANHRGNPPHRSSDPSPPESLPPFCGDTVSATKNQFLAFTRRGVPQITHTVRSPDQFDTKSLCPATPDRNTATWTPARFAGPGPRFRCRADAHGSGSRM